MYNIKLDVSKDTAAQEVLEQLLLITKCPDEKFAFSCIVANNTLKINCLEKDNPYSATELVNLLFRQQAPKDILYVNAPLEIYLTTFRPMLNKMIARLHPTYAKLIERDEMLSILYLTIIKLYEKDYYLHNSLIRRAFINDLNMECRKLKHFQNSVSLNSTVRSTDNGDIPQELMELLMCEEASQWAEDQLTYSLSDLQEDQLQAIKDYLGEFQYTLVLSRLKAKTIDMHTSRLLRKCKEELE